jgi:hypothetical protein
MGVKSGERAGYSTGPRRPIHAPGNCSSNCSIRGCPLRGLSKTVLVSPRISLITVSPQHATQGDFGDNTG